MKKVFKKLLILIVIINTIGMIIEGTTTSHNNITVINNLTEKDKMEMIKEKGVITVASALNDIPFYYLNTEAEPNKISGIDADIINEIIKRLGINKVELKEILFSNLLEKLNTDDGIDMAAGGIYITSERENVVAFTKPLYKESETVIVPKFSKINSKEDLKNTVVGVEKGTEFEALARKWKKNNLIKDIVIFESTSELLKTINNGEIDAGIADSVVVSYFLLKDKSLSLRTLQDYIPEVPGDIGIAVKKNDVSLLNALNKAIDDMKVDGALYAILVENGLDKNNIIVD